jgi:hypothetical protein
MRISFFSILIILLASFSAYSQESTETLWLEGNWVGTGLQVDKKQWKVELSVYDVKKPMINYPDLGCSGHWELVQPGSNKLAFKEVITEGIFSCDQGVEVFIKKRGKNKIRVTYYLRSYSDKPIAKAILYRDQTVQEDV